MCASYSTNANIQNLVYGTTNTDWDAATTAARDVATSVINAKLGLKSDLSTVPDTITRVTTLLAAGIFSTSPEDKVENNTYWKQGMLLLEQLGEESTTEDQDLYPSIHVDGFGRYETSDEYDVYLHNH